MSPPRILPEWAVSTLPFGTMTDAAIAEKLHCGKATVAVWRRSLGFPALGKRRKFAESRLFFDLQDAILLRVGLRVPLPFRRLYRDVSDDFRPVCEAYFRKTLRHMVDSGLLTFVGSVPGPEQGYLGRKGK